MLKASENTMDIKDLIAVGIYTALYFVMVAISAFLVIFLIPGYSYAFIPVISALLSGTVYMLMVAKVPRFGAITIMGSIMGVWFFVMGRFAASLIVCLVIALLADGVAYLFKYENKKAILASYIIFSYSTIGPVIPMFLFPDRYIDQLVTNGRDITYIQTAFGNLSQFTFWAVVVGILIAAILGGLFGMRMMKKHFKRAGIV